MSATLREWLTRTGQKITHFYLSPTAHDAYGDLARWADLPSGNFSFDAVPAEILDEPFETSFGLEDLPVFYAWSSTHVWTRGEYDGSVWLTSVPRNPPA